MTDNLTLSQVSASQNNKEVTINDKGGEIDAALTEVVTLTIDNTNAGTVTQAQLQRAAMLQIDPDGTTPPDAAITITVGTAFKRGNFAVFNNTSFDVTVEVSGQSATPPTVPAGEVFMVNLDGTDVRSAGGGGGGGTSYYDVPMAYSGGPPTSSEVMTSVMIARQVTFPANFSGSYGNIGTNPTATFDIDVRDDGASIGTISISTSGVFTFTTNGGTQKVVAAGSLLEFIAPATTDSTAADMIATLAGTAA